jgi:hypothetical protein
MNVRVIEHQYKESPSHFARILSPYGQYPSDSFITKDSIYIANEKLSFSVFKNIPDNEEDFYSEVQLLYPEEIRLYSSLMLSVDREKSYSAFYPYPYSVPLLISDSEAGIDANAISEIDTILSSGLAKPNPPNYPYNHPILEDVKPPPLAGGPEYNFRDGINYELARTIYEKIDTSDGILIRGLSTFIKSRMLTMHHQFMEETIIDLYISLESSFRLVLRKLRQQGVENPTSKDASAYICSVFNIVDGADRYFEADYEDRIMSLHPESRFGIFPVAPLGVDDGYALFDNLLEIYAFLIAGYIHPKHNKI